MASGIVSATIKIKEISEDVLAEIKGSIEETLAFGEGDMSIEVYDPEDELGMTVVQFGKFRGKTLNQILEHEAGYLIWFDKNVEVKKGTQHEQFKEFIELKREEIERRVQIENHKKRRSGRW